MHGNCDRPLSLPGVRRAAHHFAAGASAVRCGHLNHAVHDALWDCRILGDVLGAVLVAEQAHQDRRRQSGVLPGPAADTLVGIVGQPDSGFG